MKQFNVTLTLVLALSFTATSVLAETAPAPATQTTTVSQSSTTTETPTSTATTVTTTTDTKTSSPAKGRKGSSNAGVLAFGYYEYSTFESLYVDFTTDHITATGLGFKGFYEYGLSERLAVGGDLSFSYLLDANFNTSLMSRSFWNADVIGAYYFTDYDKTIQPYLAFGAGVIFSDRGLTPVIDLGGGAHFKFGDSISLKAELMGKSGVIHNRVEAGLGVAFHF